MESPDSLVSTAILHSELAAAADEIKSCVREQLSGMETKLLSAFAEASSQMLATPAHHVSHSSKTELTDLEIRMIKPEAKP
jgi:hypothetical protein